MNQYPFILRSLVMRLLCAGPFFALGAWLVLRADNGWAATVPVLQGLASFIIGAVILAPALAEWVAEPAASLYMPTDHADSPVPMYGIADALRTRGDYEGAMAYLGKILSDHPHELDAYVKMIQIAILDLRDLSRAAAVYRLGIDAMPTDGDKAALTVMYQALMSRYTAPVRRAASRPLRIIPRREPRARIGPTDTDTG